MFDHPGTRELNTSHIHVEAVWYTEPSWEAFRAPFPSTSLRFSLSNSVCHWNKAKVVICITVMRHISKHQHTLQLLLSSPRSLSSYRRFDAARKCLCICVSVYKYIGVKSQYLNHSVRQVHETNLIKFLKQNKSNV